MAFYLQFHIITPLRNFTRLKRTQTRYALRFRHSSLVYPIITIALLVNLNAKAPAHIRAKVNIKADVHTITAMWIVRRHEIHKPRARAYSLDSGIMTRNVSLSFSHSVHNLTNIFLYFRRKSHGCVRVRTRNYFLYFYILSVYY